MVFHVWGILKCCIVESLLWRVRYPNSWPQISQPVSQPASGVSWSRLKPVMTHPRRGGNHSRSLLRLPCSALNQICSKPRGSPRETKTKIKGPFFLLQGPYPLLTLCFPCCCWAGQGAENCLARTLQHLTMRGTFLITTTLTQEV